MHCNWYFFLYKFAMFWIHKHINYYHKSYQCNHKLSPIKMKKWLLYTLIYYFFTGNLPPTPSWVSERPYLSRDYVTAGLTTSSAVVSILILPNPYIHWLKIVLCRGRELILAIKSLYKNHVLAKRNRSSRQSHCIVTSNWQVHFLSLFVTCYKCFILRT